MRASSMLPDIRIPRHPSYGANQDRHGTGPDPDGKERCLLCARPVSPKTAKVVLLTDDLGEITAPREDSEGTGGMFYIGSDCWRRHPELHPYNCR